MRRIWRLSHKAGSDRFWESREAALDAYLERPREAPRIFALHWRLRGRPGTPWIPYTPDRDDMRAHMARHPGRLMSALTEET